MQGEQDQPSEIKKEFMSGKQTVSDGVAVTSDPVP
jgi:hypothetical protein